MLRNTRRADTRAAGLRIESVADPDDHFSLGGERKNLGVENFRAAGGESVGLIVAELMQEPRLGGFMGIRAVDAVDVGPNDQLIGVHDVGDDGSGKIGAVAAERSDAAVGSRADEAGDDGDNAGFKKGKKNVTAALFGLFEMRLGVSESVAGQDKIRRGYGDGGDAGLFESGGEEPGAEAFTKGGETIKKFGTGGDSAVKGNFMKKVAAQELQLAADAKVRILNDADRARSNAVAEMEIVKHVEVKIQKQLSFAAGMRELAIGERVSDGEKMIGDTLHGGDDHGDAGSFYGGEN